MSRGQRRPVLADVARLAGVAPITVSRVMNGHPMVRPGTRDRVQAAVDELGYRSHMAARTLAGGSSRILGVVSVETEFFGPSRTLFGIEAAARAAGHMVSFVTVSDPSPGAFRSCFAQLDDAHAEGLVVIAPLHAAVRALRDIRPSLPLVVTSATTHAPASVGIDQALGARLATAHLLDLGHETVHHVCGPKGWIESDARADGWRRELRRQKRTVPTPLEGDWSPHAGFDAGRALAADRDVTAVFVANDQMALGVILALTDAGRRVPEDVAVVGFDDTPESAYYRPPLTTIRQDFAEVGRQSVDLLLGLMGGSDVHRSTIEPTLVVRSSTARRT